MKSTSILILALLVHFTAISQVGPSPSQPQVEKSELLTHYDLPVNIKTKAGAVHSGKVRYKCYGNKAFHFMHENSSSTSFVVIDMNAGLDSIAEIVIANPASLSQEKKVVFVPVKTAKNSATYSLMELVEKNGAYVDYKLFQATQKSFNIQDKPAPKGSVIPGFYDFFLYHKRTDSYLIKRNIGSLKKNILKYLDYCSDVTNKVEKKEKGYKQGLLLRNYDILKKVILEASTVCPVK